MKTDEEYYRYLIALSMGREYMSDFRGGPIVHYTSPEGLEGILFSEDEKIVLFASRYDCVNDTQEGKYITSVYNDVVEALYCQQKISFQQYQAVKGILPRQEALIHKKDENGECISACEKKCDMYICCFSVNEDSLAMWNYYSKNSKYQGYNIELDNLSVMDALNRNASNIKFVCYKVIYDINQQKRMIETFLLELLEYYTPYRKPTIQSVIASNLTELSMVFKNQCFYHEDEVRIVAYLPKGEDHPNFPIQYRRKDMFMIPFIKLKFPKECLQSVKISPLYCTDGEKEQQIRILKERLNYNNYVSCDVEPSHILIRY